MSNLRQNLAVRYRPTEFSQVVGQDITCRILQKQLELQNFKNCYLFAGSTGCGKTTLARVFANKINQGVGEPIEIDAASNGSVDNIRSIIESANERSLTGVYKIFIIDECHSITSTGWQAFLKGIEEPPAYTIFIFCTTEPNKMPQTILNRVQRFNISKIDAPSIKKYLDYICKSEQLTNYQATTDLISKVSNGCMRDAITMLDQCASVSKDLSVENAKVILGTFSFETMMRLTNYLLDGNGQGMFEIIDQADKEGNIRQFIDSYLEFVLDLNKYVLTRSISITNIPDYLENHTDPQLSVKYTTTFEGANLWFNKLAEYLLAIKTNTKYDLAQKSTVEAYLLKLCRGA